METRQKAKPIEELIAKYPRSREHLISILQEVQAEYGYLSRDSINRISGFLNLPSSKIFGVATFYNQFKLNAPGRIQIAMCRGTACHVKGSLNLLDTCRQLLGVEVGETTKDGLFSLEEVECLAACERSPVRSMDSCTAATTHRGALPAISPNSCSVLASSFRAWGDGLDRRNSESSSIRRTTPARPAARRRSGLLLSQRRLVGLRGAGDRHVAGDRAGRGGRWGVARGHERNGDLHDPCSPVFPDGEAVRGDPRGHAGEPLTARKAVIE
jgi:NADH:ubiquinone oxidoreductase subunit E